MSTLSVTVITLNEEKDILRSLKSVKEIADEIVVVDSGSTDKTVELCKSVSAKVYVRKFDNYSNQKNFAISKASGDWILSLDADEEIEPALAQEIREKVLKASDPSKTVAYSIPRKNIILGKFIKYSRWQPELDRHVWLFKRKLGIWEGQVHEELAVKGEIGVLKHHKIHYQYETVAQFLEMMNRYSELEAKQKVADGQKFSLIKMIVQPKYNFLVRYVYRLGFLDGWRGFILSYLMAVYHFMVWVKIWERSKD